MSKMQIDPNRSNRKTIDSLLKTWMIILQISEEETQKKCKIYENKFGSYIFIKDGNNPMVLYRDGYKKQQKIQKELCKYLPEIKYLICSTPGIDGEWKIDVYSDLFFSHYQIVIQKIKEYVEKHKAYE